MRRRLIILLLLFQFCSYAQKGARYLAQDDILIGEWHVITDSTKESNKPPILTGAEYISLLPGLEVCMIANTKNEKVDYNDATYFIAKKDGKKIYGEVSESGNPKYNGKSFSIQYQYLSETDSLIVILDDKKYHYTRIK